MKRIDLGFLLLVTCVQLLERSVGGQAAAVALTTIPKCTGGAGVEACVPLLTTRTLAGTIITRGSDGCKVVNWFPVGHPKYKLGLPYIWDFDTNLTDAQDKSGAGFTAYLTKHLPWVSTAEIDDTLRLRADPCWLVSDFYIHLYSRNWHVPLMAAHRLTEANVISGKAATGLSRSKYQSDFRKDVRLSVAQSAKCADYNGRTKGHMVPAADMKYDKKAYVNSFLLSNAGPTNRIFEDQTKWTRLEKQVARNVQLKKKPVYAMSGPVVPDPNNPRKYGALLDATRYFKVMVWCANADPAATCNLQGECYVMETDTAKIPVNKAKCDTTTLNAIKAQTGLKLFESSRLITAGHKRIRISSSLTARVTHTSSSVPKKSKTTRQVFTAEDLLTALCNHITDILTGLSYSGKLTLSYGEPQASLLSESEDFWEIYIPTNEEAIPMNPETTVTAKVRSGETVSLDQILPSPPGADSLPNTLLLDNITYDCSTSRMDVHVKVSGDLTVIPNTVVLQDAVISLSAILGPTAEEPSIQSLVFSGVWSIGSFSTRFAIKYNERWNELLFKGSSGGPVTINIKDFIADLTTVSIPLPFSSVTFDSIHVLGIIDTFAGGTATIALSGEFSGGTVHIIPQFTVGTLQYEVAFAADLYNLELADFVHGVTGVDISTVPFFGSVVISEMAVTTATGDISSYILPTVYGSGSYLGNNSNEIDQGLSAYLKLYFPSVGNIAVAMELSEDDFVFRVYSSLSLRAMLSQIPGIDVDALPLPPGLGSVLDLQISGFVFNHQLSTLQVLVDLPQDLSFFNDVLTIRYPSLTVTAVLKSPRSVTVDVDGSIEISGEDYSVDLSRDITINKYVLSVEIDHLPVSSLIQSLQAQALPDDLNALLGGTDFLDFDIEGIHLRFPLASLPQQIQVSGVPIIAGITAPRLSAIFIRQASKTLVIQGFELGSLNFADLFQQLTGSDLRSIAILNQDLDVAMLVSPATLPGVQLIGDKLQSFSIVRGVSLQAVMTWPADCSSDAFCAVAQALLGADASFMLQATYSSATSYSLSAGLDNVQLGGGLTLSDAGLIISVGTSVRVGIQGSMVLTNPSLTFTGGISVGTQGVVLELSMTGCWDRAFELPWLSLCSLYLAAALKPIPAPLVGLALGGQVKVGDPSCSNQIVGSGFIGIDPTYPLENYYYASIDGAFTIDSILSAFCLHIPLPQPLADSGFPSGLLTSFSLVGKELPHVPLFIPPGFILSGAFNILGLSVFAEVRLNLPTELYINISMPVLNLGGGLLSMYASETDHSKGPYMIVDITLLPTPKTIIEASGYVSVLGIELETVMVVTNTHTEFSVEGRMLNLFEVSLYVYDSYTKSTYSSITSATYRVQGSFRIDLFSTLKTIVSNGLQDAADAANAAISSAQSEVQSKQKLFDDANAAVSQAQQEVNAANSAFDSAVREVQRLQDQINSICSIQSCGSVCIGCFDGTDCCGSAWGQCVCWTPRWNGCCHGVTDPTCLAQNAACYALKEPLQAALQVAEVVVDQSRHVLDVANAALEAAKVQAVIAKGVLDGVVATLEGVKQTFHTGLEAANVIASVGLGGVINIEKLEFDVLLSAAATGYFSGSVTASFGGQPSTTVSINVDLYDVTAMARQLADHVVSGLSTLF